MRCGMSNVLWHTLAHVCPAVPPLIAESALTRSSRHRPQGSIEQAPICADHPYQAANQTSISEGGRTIYAHQNKQREQSGSLALMHVPISPVFLCACFKCCALRADTGAHGLRTHSHACRHTCCSSTVLSPSNVWKMSWSLRRAPKRLTAA